MIERRYCLFIIVGVLCAWINNPGLSAGELLDRYPTAVDTIPFNDRFGDFLTNPNNNFIDLEDPGVIDQEVRYDPVTGQYIITEKIGDDNYRPPTYMTFSEYLEWKSEQQEQNYFDRLAGISSAGEQTESDEDPIANVDVQEDLVDRLFGGTEVEINPQGNIDLTFGADYRRIDNPTLPLRQQRRAGFDFDMDINMSVSGQIGEKLKLNTNYNTNSTFNFEDQLKLQFDSEAFSEDDIVKKIEAGNVSLPLKSSLIQGSQSLFGIKTQLQFGYLRLTAIASQQKSQQENIQIEGGSQVQEFKVRADEYDENRHFLLSHYNRDVFENVLSNMPQVNSLFKITRIEVWVTNIRNQTEDLREIVAVSDLGTFEKEKMAVNNPDRWAKNNPPATGKSGKNPLPDNSSNKIYEALQNDPLARNLNTVVDQLEGPDYNFESGKDYERKRARLLKQSEYTLHPELGFISLNVGLQPDEVLAVSYEYTYNGDVYKVGEFSNEQPAIEGDSADVNVIFTKMLKSSQPSVDIPLWNLMMKNVYSIGAYQANREDFQFDIFYEDPGEGLKRFLPEPGVSNRPLLRLFNLDNLNEQGDPQPDGQFDFVPGLTIFPSSGRVMFPILEPFGNSLKEKLGDDEAFERYGYPELYNMTKFRAQEFQENNKFVMKGEYKSSVSSEISLGAFNIPEGSVRVTAGGQVLQEGVDYEVDYNIGKVRILNDALLESGVPINVSFEDNTLFSLQTKTLVGLRADYTLSDHMTLGGTYMHLWERPYTQKVNIGDDPINNRIFGLDFSYDKEAPWLTRAVDKLPGIDTKAKSNVSLYVEGAALKPGHSRAINQGGDESGTVYLDDFEGSTTNIDLRTPSNEWALASIPQNDAEGNNPLFPESGLSDTFLINANRALLNWYRIERNFSNNSNPYTRIIGQQEIFPNRSLAPGLYDFRTFDISYYPDERGPYNYERPGGTDYSMGLDNDGSLSAPETRWGGMMRSLPTTDFETANIEYIEFWMLNPFIQTDDPQRAADDGKLYINLGSVSEDILKDGATFYENGLPEPGSNVPLFMTNMARVPKVPPVIDAFSNNEEARQRQDVGLDGYPDSLEREAFDEYLTAINNSGLPADVKQEILDDPSNDNYRFFDSDEWPSNADVLTRYSRYNNPENNSPIAQAGQRRSEAYTNFPNTEDLNEDNTSDQNEAYYQYEIPLERSGSESMQVNEYITDTVVNPNNEIWYRFKIPIEQYDSKVGNIRDFRSIKFIRMYLTDFENPVTLRFATLDLVRNQWRRLTRNHLISDGKIAPGPPGDDTEFDISAVNIEEHSERMPFNYVLPEGIEREENFQATYQNAFLNEQSLAMNICNLKDGDARAAFKVLNLDMRVYKRLKMFVHAEAKENSPVESGDMTIFMRLGSDFSSNYYEYEIPLQLSDPSGDVDNAKNIWPDDNEFNFKLDDLVEAKKERNSNGFPLNEIFEMTDPDQPDNKIKVKGNPTLGEVQSVLIGIKNRDDQKGPVCTEVWLNELRLTGLDEKGGTAGLARVDMKLADLGNIAFSGNYSSIGWGGLEEKLQERNRKEVVQYDISTNLELSKFLPENSRLKIPFFAQYSRETHIPQYDPYDLDIELDEKLENAPTDAARDSLREQAVDKKEITSINFTNVRFERGGGSSGGARGRGQGRGGGRGFGGGGGGGSRMPWDISNFSISYSYTRTRQSDPILKRDNIKHHKGQLDYRYSRQANYLEPLKGLSDSKWLALITSININPFPNSFNFNTNIDRRVNVREYRFSEDQYSTWYDRRFNWNRNYDLKWDLTKSLKINFNASSKAVIDELNQNGYAFAEGRQYDPSQREEYLWNNIKDFGRTKNYQHSMSVTYNVPLRKIPALDWITIRAQFNADYNWNRAAVNVDSLGNTIQNSQRRVISGDFNFDRLYAKWDWLGDISGGGGSSRGRGTRRGIRRNPQQRSSGSGRGGNDGQQANEDEGPSTLTKILVRPLLLLRKAQFNYEEKYNTVLPGYMPNAEFLGMGRSMSAPGVNFLAGFQPDNNTLMNRAVDDGWITENFCLNNEVVRGYTKNWSAEVTLEPFRDFNVDVKMNRNFNNTETDLFKNYDMDPGQLDYQFKRTGDYGSYSISYFAMNTLFGRKELSELRELFVRFSDSRDIISQRLNETGNPHPEDPNYREGYGRIQQEVLIPAFLSAYTETDPRDQELDVFDTDPKPNWKVRYNGLSRLPGFKEVFSSVTIRHGYESKLNVNSYNAQLQYDPEDPDQTDDNFNYYSEYVIPAVVIDEKLNPLVGIDLKTRNDIEMNFEYRKSRRLSMSFNEYKLNETKTTEITAGFGYTIKNFSLPFGGSDSGRGRGGRRGPQNTRQSGGGGGVSKSNDLRLTMSFSLRDDITVAHTLDLDIQPQPTRGMRSIRINPAAEYDLNKSLKLRLFCDYSKSVPKTSQSYPMTNIQAGLTVRFTLN